jgi:hypothetical protein
MWLQVSETMLSRRVDIIATRGRLEKVVTVVADRLRHNDLTKRPKYYDHIVNSIFRLPELSGLLKHPRILSGDESVNQFIEVLCSTYEIKPKTKIAILCSGSGRLSIEMCERLKLPNLSITSFDFSREMLCEDVGSTRKCEVDLSKPISLTMKHDLALCLGGLRYFSEQLQDFISNSVKIVGGEGNIFMAEVDLGLISKTAGFLESKGYHVSVDTMMISVFRNTLFYFLYEKYITDSDFRKEVNVIARCDDDYKSILIEMAGYKNIECHYCHAKKLKA